LKRFVYFRISLQKFCSSNSIVTAIWRSATINATIDTGPYYPRGVHRIFTRERVARVCGQTGPRHHLPT